MVDERSRGMPPILSGAPHVFKKPYQLPKNFLYFGTGIFLGHLDALIFQRGIRTLKTKGIACPCNDTQRYGGTGVARPDCAACHGLGVAFVENTTEELRALVSEIDETDSHGMPSGSVRVTLPSQVQIATGDKLIFPDVVVQIAFMRKYRKSVGGFAVPFKSYDVHTAVTKHPKPEDGLITLVHGRDYTFSVDKRMMIFPDGSRVKDGMVVSCEFLAVPEYIVTRIDRSYRSILETLDDGSAVIQLPKLVTCSRADSLIGLSEPEVVGSGRVD